MLGSGIAMRQICCRIVVSLSVAGVRSRCPCSGVWLLLMTVTEIGSEWPPDKALSTQSSCVQIAADWPSSWPAWIIATIRRRKTVPLRALQGRIEAAPKSRTEDRNCCKLPESVDDVNEMAAAFCGHVAKDGDNPQVEIIIFRGHPDLNLYCTSQ